jgi:hypothetical protein
MNKTERPCDIVKDCKLTNMNPHYHCSNCDSPQPTGMMGHYKMISKGKWGFTCAKKQR